MTDAELNRHIKSEPYDRLLAPTILPFIPSYVRPNHVTMVRFLASPFVFWLLWEGEYGWGLLAFLLTALTDAIDGSMARTRRQITVWGTIYDGVADKFLIGGVVLILVLKHLGLWLAGFILGLELFTIVGAFYYKRKGILHPANWWGKIKMNLQVLATVALLVDLIWSRPAFSDISVWIFGASFVFGILSIIAHATKLEHA